ncbi:BnaC08g44660D [Brassica napus]|uniref:BnaC08g44660D protein n=1 Tax=Brassica napus TaxID=3708 RepID=A0A078F677_BRANA|nr:BnaC08g44660D [Brassica napus]
MKEMSSLLKHLSSDYLGFKINFFLILYFKIIFKKN